jgi:CheY-like chemotaxis protein
VNTGDSLRILCIDDNPEVADSTAEMLTLLGYDARGCYGGPSALTLAEEFAPHVCLIDLNMPGMDGDEVAARFRATGRPMALVAVTAVSDDTGRQRIAAAGFHVHLVKPVDPRRLSEVVASFRPGRTLDKS